MLALQVIAFFAFVVVGFAVVRAALNANVKKSQKRIQ